MPVYEEWLQTGSITGLVDPEAPTFATGSALDKFLFVPGSDMPSTFLPQSVASELAKEGVEDRPFFPGGCADVHPYE